MLRIKLLALDLLQVFNIEANRNSIYHAPLAEMGLLIDMRHESLDCLLVFLADNDLSEEISFIFGTWLSIKLNIVSISHSLIDRLRSVPDPAGSSLTPLSSAGGT